MSPTKRRTEKWLREHIPRKINNDHGLHKIKEGRIVKERSVQRKKRASFWNFAFWFSGYGKSQDDDPKDDDPEDDDHEDDDLEDDDLEGDTMIDEAGYDNDLTLVEGDYDHGSKHDETAHALQQYGDRSLDLDDPCIQDWTQEERWLFTKLANRGYEPLLHTTWIMDYPTFPEQLFSADENQVYINNIHSSTGRGKHTLVRYSFSSV